MMRRSGNRAGLTLFEVIVAMAIFLISLVPIYQLITLATDRAIDVKMSARTSQLCQSKMSEVIIGVQALDGSGAYADYPDQKDIQWKMESSKMGADGLYMVQVWVKYEAEGSGMTESYLSRMVFDPSNRGSTLDEIPPLPATTTPATPMTTTPQ
jgi:general secretion pathway protein I